MSAASHITPGLEQWITSGWNALQWEPGARWRRCPSLLESLTPKPGLLWRIRKHTLAGYTLPSSCLPASCCRATSCCLQSLAMLGAFLAATLISVKLQGGACLLAAKPRSAKLQTDSRAAPHSLDLLVDAGRQPERQRQRPVPGQPHAECLHHLGTMEGGRLVAGG